VLNYWHKPSSGKTGLIVSTLEGLQVGRPFIHAVTFSETISEKCSHLANDIEQQIYSHHGQAINAEYKESIRSHIFNLKDAKNNLRNRLVNDQLQASTFADMVRFTSLRFLSIGSRLAC
jgi:hypothetical protein